MQIFKEGVKASEENGTHCAGTTGRVTSAPPSAGRWLLRMAKSERKEGWWRKTEKLAKRDLQAGKRGQIKWVGERRMTYVSSASLVQVTLTRPCECASGSGAILRAATSEARRVRVLQRGWH